VELLVTDRLALRPWRVEDAAEALGINGHPDRARWLSLEMDHVPDLAAMRLLLQQWVAEDARMPAPAGAGPSTGPTMGGCWVERSCCRCPRGREDLEVGWQLHPQVWGHGYASETTRALAGWAFRHDIVLAALRAPSRDRSAAGFAVPVTTHHQGARRTTLIPRRAVSASASRRWTASYRREGGPGHSSGGCTWCGPRRRTGVGSALAGGVNRVQFGDTPGSVRASGDLAQDT
jgi:RimJ/RimL family protein N-acetyltransferase